MSTTPRPWSADHLWHRDTGAPIQYAHIKADKQVIASAVNRDDADLIVTAVNEHDALVAKVAAYEDVLAEVRAYAESLVFKGRGEPDDMPDEGASAADHIAGELLSILSGEPTS